MKLNLNIFSLMFCFLFSVSAYGQNIKSEKTIYQHISPLETATIAVDITGYDMNRVGALKDELLGYEEKVLSIKMKTELSIMYITYNGNMSKVEMEQAFIRNGISFLATKPQNTVTTELNTPDKQ